MDGNYIARYRRRYGWVLVEHGIQGSVRFENVVVKKALEMQDNPEIGPSTELGQILREILKKGKISIVNFQRRWTRMTVHQKHAKRVTYSLILYMKNGDLLITTHCLLCIHLNPSQFVFKHTKTVMISVGLEMINAIMSIIWIAWLNGWWAMMIVQCAVKCFYQACDENRAARPC